MRVVDLPAETFLAALDTLRASPIVAAVDIDRTRSVGAAPNDTAYAEQWALPQIGWDQLYGTTTPAGSALVAVLDTGVDGGHPDLDGVVVPGISILDGSNGLTDANGHGTGMASIVGGEVDNSWGVAGVAYDGVSIMPVTVLDASGQGQDSDVIAGVVYAADHGADVILMAFSNPGFSPALQAAIDYAWAAGAVLVAAVGNDSSTSATYPAGDRGVIGVAATDQTDALAGFSNYGEAAFMAAPGVDIQASVPGDNRTAISGTSAAAAHVAGAAALLAALDSAASNGAIVGRLARNADPTPSTRHRQRPPEPRPRRLRHTQPMSPARWRRPPRRRRPACRPVCRWSGEYPRPGDSRDRHPVVRPCDGVVCVWCRGVREGDREHHHWYER